MRWMVFIVMMFAARAAAAQQVDLKSLDSLGAKAKEKVEISMDESMLKSASTILSNNGDEASAKKVVEGLKGVYGRVYEFDKAGTFSERDLEPIRKQLKEPDWSIMARVSERDGETVEMWVHRTNGNMDGMLFIVAEDSELVIFNVVGVANLAELAKIGGQFGIPQILPAAPPK
jgi:hypothetical protein